jgi:5-methylcytosine-specific restriction enzyme A
LDKLPFIPNQIIKRSEIHDRFGGNRQSGICPSRTFPYIFIFSGSQGKAHGYKDAWDNPDIFSYTGEGQAGDMQFTKGNLALRDHIKNNKRVFLFEYVRSGYVRFESELEFYDADYFETHDTSRSTRLAIRFFFKRKGAILHVAPTLFDVLSAADKAVDYGPNRPNVTERKGLVTSRVGQGAYRKSIIHRWEYKCAVTGFDKAEILIASHIHPWKDANNDERLDVNNGILLSPVYDALFDRHLITFEDSGKIRLSTIIENQAYQKIGITGKENIRNLSSENQRYLEMHRGLFLGG